MSAADSLFQSYGGLSLPLNPDDFVDGLRPVDPGKSVMTALFKSAINAELGEVWEKLFGGVALPEGHALRDSTPVRNTLELEPSPQLMRELSTPFPLLAVHRAGTGTYEQVTLNEDRLTQQWLLHYILGPLDAGDARKFLDVCIAAAKIIRLVIRQQGHKSYQNGAVQFGPDNGAFATIELKSHEGPGQARFAGDESGTLYYALTLNLETTEITDDNIAGQAEDMEGVMLEVGVGDGQEILPGLIYADSAVPFQYP